MNDLRKAAEQALEALESLDCGDSYKTHNAASALRQALAQPDLAKVGEVGVVAAIGELVVVRIARADVGPARTNRKVRVYEMARSL